ncbi:c-type cytochrome biogenesis protein CcsB [Oryzihumus sp.]|uniref:c-type cytochrome biogenesis protein CcsB n=1 Tax=Oryzihumus sp. TaxID=1968903 RepID=UPI002ED998AC
MSNEILTNQTLASYSNLSLYSAMAVFTIAMISFAIDLAGVAPKVAAPARELAGAGGPATTEVTPAAPAPRRRKAAGIGMSLSWLGAALLVAATALRGLSVERPPLGNMYEFSLVGCSFVMAVFLGLSTRRDLRWLGLFVVGPVLLTLGLAITVFYTAASQLLPSLKSYWLVIHVTVATLSVAVFTIAFSVTILYLVMSWLEALPAEQVTGMRAKVHTALPSARQLDRTAYGLHIVAFPLWTFTLIAGAIWAEQAWGHYWNWDPKEVWTFVIWVVYAAYLHARATTGWSVRRAAYLALAGYGCILVNYMVVNVFFVGQHSYSGM